MIKNTITCLLFFSHLRLASGCARTEHVSSTVVPTPPNTLCFVVVTRGENNTSIATCAICAVLRSLSCGMPFVAVHVYRPPEDWFRLTRSRRGPWPMTLPSLVQVTFGLGLPRTLHSRVVLEPSFTDSSKIEKVIIFNIYL